MQESIKAETSDLMRVRRATEVFGLSESFLRHAMMRGEINSYKLGRAVFVSRSEIEKKIFENKVS